ncbi:MAG: hypothetical protein KJT03_04420, partial [Verrucomicrobiae bacterium]|nr:hypothetical protein [Verrucomicrobiae bacterium]
QYSYDLKPGFSGPDFSPEWCSPRCESYTSLYRKGLLLENLLKLPDKRSLGVCSGYAWAARRDLLLRHTLYDACIVGGGDGAMLAGFRGNFQEIIDYLEMNPRRTEHFLEWAEPVFAEVAGNLGYSPGTVYHLWHGEIKDRNYGPRRIELERHQFDPYEDIAIASNGCWRWNSGKPELHDYLRAYFASRFEDGRS